MTESLLEQLPRIVAEGRRQAERLLAPPADRDRKRLRTRERVLPRPVAAATCIRYGNGDDGWRNRLIQGDNLHAMAALLAGDEDSPSLRGSLDLIYIDPPFDSGTHYRTRAALPGAAPGRRPSVIERFAYSDTWADGTASYLAMLVPRLVLMRELLAETGSIYVHVDPGVGHYVKIVLDAIFGRQHFQREIVWRIGWISGYKSAAANWIRNHDNILYYTKSSEFVFNKQYLPYAADYVRRDGRKPSGTGHPIEDTWNCSDVDRLDSLQIMSFSREKLGYDTQKNERLLARIVTASTREGALVADFFGGAGTTAAVAERLGRRWITSDLGGPACTITRRRLLDLGAAPFLCKAVDDDPLESARARFGRGFGADDLSAMVLSLYGAVPLPAGADPSRKLGMIVHGNDKTLVLVDSPAGPTGEAALRAAIARRDDPAAGWRRVVVLGWRFEPGLGERIAALRDPGLEVLAIPPDLPERVRRHGGTGKPRGRIRFSSLRYLTIEPVRLPLRRREAVGAMACPDEERVVVALDGYVLLSPDAIDLDGKHRARLLDVLHADPLALIDSWAVDPDYDGEVFQAAWRHHRGRGALRVAGTADFVVPRKSGERRICVRVMDVLGVETEATRRVAEPGPSTAP